MSKQGVESEIKALIAALTERYEVPEAVERPESDDETQPDALVDEVVRGMLQWEASAEQASAAYERVTTAATDYNELRVCFPDEIASMLPSRYPRGAERAVRLRAVLNDIYDREHALTLEHLRDAPKREARAYAETLEGITGFASSRLVLLGLGGHAMPLDERLAGLVRGEGILADEDAATIAGRMERAIRAGDARPAYELLELWAADGGASLGLGGPAAKPAKRSRTTAKKKTAKAGAK